MSSPCHPCLVRKKRWPDPALTCAGQDQIARFELFFPEVLRPGVVRLKTTEVPVVEMERPATETETAIIHPALAMENTQHSVPYIHICYILEIAETLRTGIPTVLLLHVVVGAANTVAQCGPCGPSFVISTAMSTRLGKAAKR